MKDDRYIVVERDAYYTTYSRVEEYGREEKYLMEETADELIARSPSGILKGISL